MKFTEIIEKVKNNLKIQEELKNSLADSEQAQKDYEEKLCQAIESLEIAEVNEEELKESLLSTLGQDTVALKDNLDMVVFNKFECGLTFKFLKKGYDLLAMDHLIEPGNKGLEPELYLEEMLEKYLNNGKVMFNEETISKMKEIKKLYDIDPEVATGTLENLDYNKKVKKLEARASDIKLSIKRILDRLDQIHTDLKKSKDIKSPLLKKIFTKREKLQVEEQISYDELENLNKQLKALESKLQNKEFIKEESACYVKKEMESLKKCFAWIESFESIKSKLAQYRIKHIQAIKRQIHDIEEQLASTKTKIKQDKGMLQLNKKINNEIVYNAFGNEKFVNELNANKSVEKGDENAFKFVKNRYNEYLQGCIEKLVI